MIDAELADEHAVRVGRKRVARLMRSAGCAAWIFVRTTLVDAAAARATDLVDRKFGSSLGRRHHLRADLGRLLVPGVGEARGVGHGGNARVAHN
jgi:hypothetical protein